VGTSLCPRGTIHATSAWAKNLVHPTRLWSIVTFTNSGHWHGAAVTMGTDIHLFAEYDTGNIRGLGQKSSSLPQAVAEPFAVAKNIKSIAEGEFFIPRDYALFDALAGVRHNNEKPPPLIPPRGFPIFASLDVTRAYFSYVCDDGEPPLEDHDVTRFDADKYVARGASIYRDHPSKPRGWVSEPDWHTPSWLFLHEIEAALRQHDSQFSRTSIEFQAVSDLLFSLEKHYPKRTRIVFWFDN